MKLAEFLLMHIVLFFFCLRIASMSKNCLSCVVERNSNDPHFKKVLKDFLESRNNSKPLQVKRVIRVQTKFLRGFWYNMTFTSPVPAEDERGTNGGDGFRNCTAIWTYLPWGEKYEKGAKVYCKKIDGTVKVK